MPKFKIRTTNHGDCSEENMKKAFHAILEKKLSERAAVVYVRYKGADNFEEELLFCPPLELRSRGIDVYNKVNEYFNAQSLKWENCISVSLVGAQAMLGINGFSAFVKKITQILKLLTV